MPEMNHNPKIVHLSDLPMTPVTIGDMSFNRTGLWRYLKPVVQDRTAPCRQACPLGMPSPGFINDLANGKPSEALARIMAVNPLPGITGRLCYHPCQARCLRRELDRPIQIQKLGKHLADTAESPEMKINASPKGRALVLGSGPVGLGAAYFLGLAGLRVTMLDPLERAGGFLTGVAKEKLPAEILGREIERLSRAAGLDMVQEPGRERAEALTRGASWDLVIFDNTAHGPNGEAAHFLSALVKMLPQGQIFLPAKTPDADQAYKASQVAVALKAGRDLAAGALKALGMGHGPGQTNASSRADAAVGAKDIRYDLIEAAGRDIPAAWPDSLSRSQALAEAGRCMSCGHCNLCGRCMVFCPDVSLGVDSLTQKPQMDPKHCKGCGICAHECPRGAIVMEKE